MPTIVLHCTEAMLIKPVDEIGLLQKGGGNVYLALSGSITFSKASRELLNLAFDVPLDRLLIGTGAPDFLPAPLAVVGHSRMCTPADAIFVAAALAEMKNCSVDDILSSSLANAKRCFGI